MAGSELNLTRPPDPRRIADIMLAAAVRAAADAVYLEPSEGSEDKYVVTFERAQAPLAKLTLDGMLGAATIARLAFLANVDLAAPHASSAVVPVRSGDRQADV